MKKISIISPTYNEEGNIQELFNRIDNSIKNINSYEFEIIFIDNDSEDKTQEILKGIAGKDKRVKLIFNNRNFGHIRSPYWGIMQTSGDATIYLASDLQDPPEYISNFITEWENGWKVVLATKNISKTNKVFHGLRRLYYTFLDKIVDFEIIKNSTGFGIYDKKVIDQIRKINDPYPFLRGLISELGYPVKRIEFVQPEREHGITKNNIYTLYDIGILGIISHSNIFLRICSFMGYLISGLSFVFAGTYLFMKVYDVHAFPKGVAPLIIIIFLFFGLLFSFLGILGEYIALIYNHVRNRPIIVEKERYNFE